MQPIDVLSDELVGVSQFMQRGECEVGRVRLSYPHGRVTEVRPCPVSPPLALLLDKLAIKDRAVFLVCSVGSVLAPVSLRSARTETSAPPVKRCSNSTVLLTLMPESTLTPAPVRTAVLPFPSLRYLTILSTESGIERYGAGGWGVPDRVGIRIGCRRRGVGRNMIVSGLRVS